MLLAWLTVAGVWKRVRKRFVRPKIRGRRDRFALPVTHCARTERSMVASEQTASIGNWQEAYRKIQIVPRRRIGALVLWWLAHAPGRATNQEASLIPWFIKSSKYLHREQEKVKIRRRWIFTSSCNLNTAMYVAGEQKGIRLSNAQSRRTVFRLWLPRSSESRKY